MSWITGLAIFFIIWWTVLFVVLPFGVRSQDDQDEVVAGTHSSAPAEARIGRKLIQTTVAAAVVFLVYYVVTQIYGLGPDDLPHIVPGA